MKARALALAGVAAAAGLALWRQASKGLRTQTEADRAHHLAGGNAISRIPSQPPLYAYRIAGKLTSADVEAMATELSDAFDRGETVDILIEMPGYEGAELGAMFNPLQMVAQVRSLKHVRRYAVVAPPAWAGAMITVSDAIIPVEARVFEVTQMAEAWAWVSAPQDMTQPEAPESASGTMSDPVAASVPPDDAAAAARSA